MDKNKIFRLLLFIFAPLIFLILVAVIWFWKSEPTPQPISDNTANKTIENVSNKISPTPQIKGIKDEKLQRQTDALVPLFGNFQSVPVFVVDEPVNHSKAGAEPGVAYADCDRKNVPTIYVKKEFYQKANSWLLGN